MLKALNVFLFTPYLFALLMSIFGFLKNPVYIRRIASSIFLFEFIFASVMLFSQDLAPNFFGVDLAFDKFSSYLLLLVSFVFLSFSIISKTFIKILHKVFYSTSLLLFGLINLLILSDNIFVSLIVLFWIFLLFLPYPCQLRVAAPAWCKPHRLRQGREGSGLQPDLSFHL